jgi:molybdate transport system substrate-binding protein
VFNFGSSSDLATQLAEGAPADVFASANNRQMQVAQDAGRIAAHHRRL